MSEKPSLNVLKFGVHLSRPRHPYVRAAPLRLRPPALPAGEYGCRPLSGRRRERGWTDLGRLSYPSEKTASLSPLPKCPIPTLLLPAASWLVRCPRGVTSLILPYPNTWGMVARCLQQWVTGTVSAGIALLTTWPPAISGGIFLVARCRANLWPPVLTSTSCRSRAREGRVP